MGGNSSSSQTQSSTTAPWQPAQGAIQGILGQLQGNLANTGVTGAENGALNNTVSNATNWAGQYAPTIGANATTLLNGGGATNQAGAVNQNYLDYAKATQPLASNTNYDPMQTPGLGTQLQGIQNSVGSQINGQFAAAGRDGSPANSQAYGYGVTQAMAPVLTAQYNQNVQNQQGAAGNLYNAGNTNAGILSGFQQQALANQQQGTQAAGDALNAQNSGNSAAMQAEAQRRGIPVQALGLLSQIGIPIAGLGGTSTSTGNTQNQMSGAQQFGLISGGLGSLMPKAPMTFNF